MTVYILEDEINILNYIISLIKDIPELLIVGYATTIAQAKSELENQNPDIILADIGLKDGNSFTLLNNINFQPQIIFITAYNEFAIDAINIGAFAYILKPIEPKVFYTTLMNCYTKVQYHHYTKKQVELAENFYNDRKVGDRIALKGIEFTQIVKIEDIIYCQSNQGYTTFQLQDLTSIVVSKVLKEYEQLLPSASFLRCHQSYLVHTKYIHKYYREGFLELTNKQKIPVSERKKETVLAYINTIS